MKFDIISIIYVVIILLFALVGLKRGFFKTLVSFIKSVVSLVLSFFLCKPLAQLLMSGSLGLKLQDVLLNSFNNQGGIFLTAITESNKSEVVSSALQQINIPNILNGYLTNLVSNYIPTTGEGITVANALSSTISYYILIVISFILISIAVAILCFVLRKIFAVIEQIPIISSLNKIGGLLLNGVCGFIFVCIISFALTIVMPLNETLSNWLSDTMMLNDSLVFTISKYFYEQNFLVKIFAFIQSLFQ